MKVLCCPICEVVWGCLEPLLICKDCFPSYCFEQKEYIKKICPSCIILLMSKGVLW
jgi:hypothetical protein